MELFGKHRLVPHPHFLPSSRLTVSVEASICEDRTLFLTYAVTPAVSLRFPEHRHGRQESLWQSTCFELFLRPQSGGYDEYNFAPTFGWSAYRFVDWRKGMKPLPLHNDPHMVDSRIDDRKLDFPERYELDVFLELNVLPSSGGKASFTAVIEESDGCKSYWALVHPPGDTPNFHHPACFALKVPPANHL